MFFEESEESDCESEESGEEEEEYEDYEDLIDVEAKNLLKKLLLVNTVLNEFLNEQL